jgi:hypothetical protein
MMVTAAHSRGWRRGVLLVRAERHADRRVVPSLLTRSAFQTNPVAPITSGRRRFRFPCLEIPLWRSLPPLQFCFGVNPIQAAK